MRRFDIYKLYKELSKEYGISIPFYILYQGTLKLRYIKKYVGRALFMSFDSEISGVDDPFGIIFLSCTVPISSAIHEFFHYYDHFCGYEIDEEFAELRTMYIIEKKKLKNARKFSFTSVTIIDEILNDVRKFILDLFF